jgi:predicted Zn-dependent protease with MMP-like domain
VSPAPDLDTLAGGLGGSTRHSRLPNGVSERLQVVALLLGGEGRQPDNVPAARRGHPVGMPGTQVIAMRLDEGSQRAEHRGGIAVDVSQRVEGILLARRPGALTSGQLATPVLSSQPTAVGILPPTRAGSRWSLTTADGIDQRPVTPPPGAHCTIVSPAARSQPQSRLGAAGIRSVTVHDGNGHPQARPSRVHRRDRHGRGLRGALVPPDVPLHRTRGERFDDLVLLAVAQLEPRWEAELSAIEFAVEEIPPADPDPDDGELVPLARLEQATAAAGQEHPARIVLYRRPLMARADGDEELAELVLDVIVEQFAHLLGVDPQTVDPSYPGEE